MTGDNEELAALLRQCVARDLAAHAKHRAQNDFYRLLQRDLDWTARSQAGFNEEIAQAAMQEAWLKIFRQADRYDPARGPVKQWARLITARCVIDELRAHYRDPSRSARAPGKQPDEAWREDDLAGQQCPLPGADATLYGRQLERALRDCIALLPTGGGPNYRLTMELCLEPDISHADMLALLAAQQPEHRQINLAQVRGWIRQARVKVGACLQQLGLAGGDLQYE